MITLLQKFLQNPFWGLVISGLCSWALSPYLFGPGLLFYGYCWRNPLSIDHPKKLMVDNLGVVLLMSGLLIYGSYFFLVDEYLLSGNVAKARMAFYCGFQDRVNQKYDRGNTPLHYAANRGNREMIEFLVENGANVNARNAEGSTPLHQAAYYGRYNAVKDLMDRGADPGIANRYGYVAANVGESEIRQLIRSYSATGS